jgi:hypothetical protein
MMEKKSRKPSVATTGRSRATLLVVVGIGAVVLLGGALLVVVAGVSAWYFWPPKSPDLADAGPHGKVVWEEPKDKDKKPEPPPVVKPHKDKDKSEPPPLVKPPVHVDINPNIVLAIPLKEPQRRVGEILFTRQRLCVGVYRFRLSSKEASEQFELFDVATMESIARMDLPAANYSPCPRDLGPDGKFFARGTILEGRKLSIWALGNPAPVVADWSFAKPEKGEGTWAGYLSSFHLLENDRLLTFSGGGDIETWRIPEMESLWKVPAPQKFFLSSPISGVISPDRRRCAVFTGDNFRIHDTETGKLICETAPVPTPKAKKALASRSSAFSSDNAMLVTNIDDGGGQKPTLYCYDANKGNLKNQVPADAGSNFLFARVNWFGTRHYCLSAEGGRGKTVVYRASDGTKVAELIPSEGNPALQVGFRSPDPRLWYATTPQRGGGELKLVAAPLPAELERDGPAAPIDYQLSGQGLNRLGAPK